MMHHANPQYVAHVRAKSEICQSLESHLCGLAGRRCGTKPSWWYFPMSLVTRFAFGIAIFLAVQQRHYRWKATGPSG